MDPIPLGRRRSRDAPAAGGTAAGDLAAAPDGGGRSPAVGRTAALTRRGTGAEGQSPLVSARPEVIRLRTAESCRVVASPTSRFSAMSRSSRRMILPDRVL